MVSSLRLSFLLVLACACAEPRRETAAPVASAAPAASTSVAVAPPPSPPPPEEGRPVGEFKVFRSRAELGALARAVPAGFPFDRESLVLVGSAPATCCTPSREGDSGTRIVERTIPAPPPREDCGRYGQREAFEQCQEQAQRGATNVSASPGTLVRIPKGFEGRLVFRTHVEPSPPVHEAAGM